MKQAVVKITKSSNPGYWYAGFIGQIFTVEFPSFVDEDHVQKYTVMPSPGTDPLFNINVDDCKVLM